MSRFNFILFVKNDFYIQKLKYYQDICLYKNKLIIYLKTILIRFQQHHLFNYFIINTIDEDSR